jgi:hypothetical protein
MIPPITLLTKYLYSADEYAALGVYGMITFKKVKAIRVTGRGGP